MLTGCHAKRKASEDTSPLWDPFEWLTVAGGGFMQMHSADLEAEIGVEGKGHRGRARPMLPGFYKEPTEGADATKHEKAACQFKQKLRQLRSALNQPGKASIADIVAVFREQTFIGQTVVRSSRFVKQQGHNGLFLIQNCPIHSIIALLWVMNISTPADVAEYKHDTADGQTYKWLGCAHSKPLYFPYTINNAAGIIGAAANSPTPYKKQENEPDVNACFRTWTFKLHKGDEVLTYAVTGVVSMKKIIAPKEIVVRYCTEKEAGENIEITSQPPLNIHE